MSISWEQLVEQLEAEDHLRRDEIVTPDQITAHAVGKDVGILIEGVESSEFYRMTDKALDHIGRPNYRGPGSAVLKKLTGEEADAEDATLAAGLVNNTLRHLRLADPDRHLRLRLREGEDRTVRAVLSERYAPVSHLAVVEAVRVASPGNRLLEWYTDDDFDNFSLTMDLKGIGFDDAGSGYDGHIRAGNSLVADSTFWSAAELLRKVCTNGLIINVGEQRQGRRHVGSICDADVLAFFAESIPDQIGGLSGAFADLGDLASRAIPQQLHPGQWALALSRMEAEVTKALVPRIVEAWQAEPEFSAAGIINSLTRAAQVFQGRERFALESFAGTLCSTWARYHRSDFDHLLQRAEKIEDVEFSKVLAV